MSISENSFDSYKYVIVKPTSHPEKEVPNINKILPLNNYHHINLEG